MIEFTQAQVVPPEAVQALLTLMGTLVVMNAGSLLGSGFQAYLSWKKQKKDLRAAHDEIRKIKKHLGLEAAGGTDSADTDSKPCTESPDQQQKEIS